MGNTFIKPIYTIGTNKYISKTQNTFCISGDLIYNVLDNFINIYNIRSKKLVDTIICKEHINYIYIFPSIIIGITMGDNIYVWNISTKICKLVFENTNFMTYDLYTILLGTKLYIYNCHLYNLTYTTLNVLDTSLNFDNIKMSTLYNNINDEFFINKDSDIFGTKIISIYDGYIYIYCNQKLLLKIKETWNWNIWNKTYFIDGNDLFTTTFTHSIHVFNINTGTLLHTLKGHTDVIKCIVSIGNYIYTCSCDKTIHVWDKLTKNLIYIQKFNSNLYDMIVYGKKIVIRSFHIVYIFDTITRKILDTLHFYDHIYGIKIHNNLLYISSYINMSQYKLDVYDLSTKKNFFNLFNW